jgi:hypothetical protein
MLKHSEMNPPTPRLDEAKIITGSLPDLAKYLEQK